ncbi:MAG: hypothetical protein ACXVRH_07830 [Thermoleophilaceae bacterium]
MQPVPAALAPARLRLRVALVAALVAAVAASAVLELTLRRSAGSSAVTTQVGGVVLQQARCQQWLAADGPQRGAILQALTGSVGGASTSGGVGTTLTTAEATRLFDHVCSSPIARGFLLYELYIRAAGFRSLTDLGAGN